MIGNKLCTFRKIMHLHHSYIVFFVCLFADFYFFSYSISSHLANVPTPFILRMTKSFEPESPGKPLS